MGLETKKERQSRKTEKCKDSRVEGCGQLSFAVHCWAPFKQKKKKVQAATLFPNEGSKAAFEHTAKPLIALLLGLWEENASYMT